MDANLIKIGNSKGVIIPSQLLRLLGLKDKVNIEVEEDRIVITPAGNEAREGWEEMIEKEIEANGQPVPSVPDFFEDEDNSDWEW